MDKDCFVQQVHKQFKEKQNQILTEGSGNQTQTLIRQLLTTYQKLFQFCLVYLHNTVF